MITVQGQPLLHDEEHAGVADAQLARAGDPAHLVLRAAADGAVSALFGRFDRIADVEVATVGQLHIAEQIERAAVDADVTRPVRARIELRRAARNREKPSRRVREVGVEREDAVFDQRQLDIHALGDHAPRISPEIVAFQSRAARHLQRARALNDRGNKPPETGRRVAMAVVQREETQPIRLRVAVADLRVRADARERIVHIHVGGIRPDIDIHADDTARRIEVKGRAVAHGGQPKAALGGVGNGDRPVEVDRRAARVHVLRGRAFVTAVEDNPAAFAQRDVVRRTEREELFEDVRRILREHDGALNVANTRRLSERADRHLLPALDAVENEIAMHNPRRRRRTRACPEGEFRLFGEMRHGWSPDECRIMAA